MIRSKSIRRPAIVLGETDADRLTTLAVQRQATSPDLSEALLDEIARATVRPDATAPVDAIGMGSSFEYVDEAHGGSQTGRLVYPEEADIAAGKVSVFTPIGVGLLGLRPGQSIVWPDRQGRERALTVVRVGAG